MVAFLDSVRSAAGFPGAPAQTFDGPGQLSPDVLSAILSMLQSNGRGGGAGIAGGAPMSGGSPAPAGAPPGPAATSPTNGPGFLGGTGRGWGTSQIDLSGPLDDIAALVAGLVLGPIGSLGAGLIKGGSRLQNAGFADRARGSWGQEPLGFGQSLGAALGLNDYGGGGPTDRLGEYRGTPVSPGGLVREGGFLGIGDTTRGAYTPGEAQRRAAAGRYGSPFGGPWSDPRGGGSRNDSRDHGGSAGPNSGTRDRGFGPANNSQGRGGIY